MSLVISGSTSRCLKESYGSGYDDWRLQLFETALFMAILQAATMFLRRLTPTESVQELKSRQELKTRVSGTLFAFSFTFVSDWYHALENILGWHQGIGSAVCLAIAVAIAPGMDACLLPSSLKWVEAQQGAALNLTQAKGEAGLSKTLPSLEDRSNA